MEFCAEYGMEMKCSKTKFMDGSELDKIDINLEGETIAHCQKYTYLGAVIHKEATFTQFKEDHVAEKSKHLMKLYLFLNKKL